MKDFIKGRSMTAGSSKRVDELNFRAVILESELFELLGSLDNQNIKCMRELKTARANLQQAIFWLREALEVDHKAQNEY